MEFRELLPPDQLLFNHEFATDLIWNEGVPILHEVDSHTGFQDAVVLKANTLKQICV